MKKFLMAIFALAVATTVATAGVGILWTTQWGVYDHTQSDLTAGTGAMLDSYSAIWQLIYAGANNVADPVDNINWAGGAGIAADSVSGDDVVWGERTIALGGGSGNDAPYNTTWDNWLLNTAGTLSYENLGWSTAGFVYQRVFEGTPANGSWFFQSPLLALNTGFTGGGSPLQDFVIDTPTGGIQPTLQVPEPATMGLLGLGALVMAIRRRRA